MAEANEMLTLISQENESFQVPAKIMNMSILLQQMLEDNDGDYSDPVPLPGVSSRHLKTIIEYCELHNFAKA